MVDSIRYWLAALTLISLPPAILYWYLIHPFAETWRRLGRAATYSIVFGVCILMGYGLWQVRDALLMTDYGFVPWLTGIGVVLYLIAVYLELRCRKFLKFHILAGGPELSRDQPGELLDQGIYARIRHPRYLALAFGMTGLALFVNYLGCYLLLAAGVPLFYGLILFEERELRGRFGEAYVDYSRRVPRFIPRGRDS